MATDSAPAEAPARILPRWEDLEAFLVIAAGVEAGWTIQKVGDDGTHGYGGPRLLYLRLARLEEALGVRLLERRKWSRNTHLTEEGRWLAAELRRQHIARANLQKRFAGRTTPTLRLSATSTMISTLLPAVVAAMKRQPDLKGLHLTLIDHEREEDVLQDVHENRAAVGLALHHGHAHVPSDVRVETLVSSPRVVLCHESHPFVTRARHDPTRAAVEQTEMAHERVFVRPHDARYLPTPSSLGEHFLVPRFEEARAYVRVGLGITISLETLESLLGPDEHLRALPLEPMVPVPIGLIAPRKREGALNGFLPAFFDIARSVVAQAKHPKPTEFYQPSPPFVTSPDRRLAETRRQRRACRPAPRRAAEPFDVSADITPADWLALHASLDKFKELRYWEDYLFLACYHYRLDPARASRIVHSTSEAWAGIDSILHHWSARANWPEFARYAFAVRLLGRYLKRKDFVITPHEWAGMYDTFEDWRRKHEWYHCLRHASRMVRLDPPALPRLSEHEWRQVAALLEALRADQRLVEYGRLARAMLIVREDATRPLLSRSGRDWTALRGSLDTLRQPGDDPRQWLAFAQHAYSLARIAGHHLELPPPPSEEYRIEHAPKEGARIGSPT